MAAVHNLYVDQGADFTVEVGIYDDNNAAWNLTGYSVAAKIKKSYYSSTSTSFTATVSSTSTGTVVLTLLDSVTTAMDPGRYLYDVIVTSAGGTKTRVIEGIVTINPGVT
tara:strand:- start:704 stop:1033 length:330 start_codon:yes stop_codon:yes gene_type:complete